MNKKGFTLVELLAVIALLAILILLALPNILKLFNQAKKNIFLTEARTIYSEAQRKYSLEALKGNKVSVISSNGENKLSLNSNNKDYCVILDNKGKITSIKVTDEKYSISYDGTNIDGLKIENVTEEELDLSNCTSKQKPVNNCVFDGELVQGAEYTNGQYTYRYMQENNHDAYDGQYKWLNIEADGWGVILTDKDSTNPVTTPLCTSINGKPIVSMASMFANSQATSIDLSGFDTSNVINMSNMFNKYGNYKATLPSKSNDFAYKIQFLSATTTILDLSSFDTSNVTDMSSMFEYSVATSIDLSGFDTSKVTDMSFMFYNSQATELDLRSFDTSNVTNMSWMFANSQATELDLSSFDTRNVINMSTMFSGSQAITIDLSSFNTNRVTDMSFMFSGSQVTTIDLSSFNTNRVTNMRQMFSSAYIETIYVGDNWTTNNIIEDYYSGSLRMFKDALNIVGGQGTTYSSSNPIDKTYAHVDGGTSNPGYFTYKAN